MKLNLFAVFALVVSVSNAYPKPPQQFSSYELSAPPEPFPLKQASSKAELREYTDTYFKQKTKMPIKEKKQKDGIRTMRFKKVRRVGPPFSEYLEGAQRQELLEVIKQARATGKSQDEVRQTIDSYLQSHLSAEKLAIIEKVKAEGARQERERVERVHRNMTDTEHQTVNRFLDEQREQLSGLLEMTQSLKASDDVNDHTVDNYLQNTVDDGILFRQLNEPKTMQKRRFLTL